MYLIDKFFKIVELPSWIYIEGSYENLKEGIGLTMKYKQNLEDSYGFDIKKGGQTSIFIGNREYKTHVATLIARLPLDTSNAIVISEDFLILKDIQTNIQSPSKLYLFIEEDIQNIDKLVKDLNHELPNLIVSEIRQTKRIFTSTNFLGLIQDSLTPFNIYGAFAALASIIIVSINHVEEMSKDLAILRARGLGKKSYTFTYVTMIPIMIISIIIGITSGFASGYGASHQFITNYIGFTFFYPLSI